MDVGEIISEMNGIGIQGFSKPGDTDAQALDVIKRGVMKEGRGEVTTSSFGENQERARVVLKRMSAITDQVSKVSVGLREQLREAGALLQEMDGAAAELRRVLNE